MATPFLFAAEASAPAKPMLARLPASPEADQPAAVAEWTEERATPRPLRLHFLRADLRDPRIEPCVIVADDPDGDGPAEASLTKPADLAKKSPTLLAAVNANAFAHLTTATEAERLRGWYAGKAVNIEGLAAAEGRVRSPSQAGRIPFWFDDKNTPHQGDPGLGEKIRGGVADWGELLLSNGTNMVKQGAVLHPRTLAGFDATGRWLLLAVADGRWKGRSEGLSLKESADLMKQHGCAQAVNLDGGGSSILLVRPPGKDGLEVVNHPSDGRPRPIPVMLGIRTKN